MMHRGKETGETDDRPDEDALEVKRNMPPESIANEKSENQNESEGIDEETIKSSLYQKSEIKKFIIPSMTTAERSKQTGLLGRLDNGQPTSKNMEGFGNPNRNSHH